MSKSKFALKQLGKLRRSYLDCVGEHHEMNKKSFPVDWLEFNKMFNTKKNVIVEYPTGQWAEFRFLVGFYAAIKVAKYNACVGICDFSRTGFPGIRNFAKKLSNKNMDDNVLFTSSTTPFKDYKNRVLECDEWILNADWSTLHPVYPPDDHSCDGGVIFKAINDTRGFSELDVNEELWTANRTLMGWEDKERKRLDRRFVIMWDDKGKDALANVVAKYPDQFLVIPYTKEKELVDKWFRKNETMLDPGFDIQIMEPGLNQRKAFLYAATNHLYAFREYVRVLPDVVGEFLSKSELKDLM